MTTPLPELLDLDFTKAELRASIAKASEKATTGWILQVAEDIAAVLRTRAGRDAVATGEALLDVSTLLAFLASMGCGPNMIVNVLGSVGLYLTDNAEAS